MAEPLCVYVYERATEGPCQEMLLRPNDKCLGAPVSIHCPSTGTCTQNHYHHTYLGPVLRRCGRREGEWRHAEDTREFDHRFVGNA